MPKARDPTAARRRQPAGTSAKKKAPTREDAKLRPKWHDDRESIGPCNRPPVAGGSATLRGTVEHRVGRVGASNGTEELHDLDPRAECQARERSTTEMPSRDDGKEHPHGQQH